MKPEWRDNPELNRRVIEWSKTGAGKPLQPRNGRCSEGKTIEAANLRNEVLAESTRAAQQIMRELRSCNCKKRV